MVVICWLRLLAVSVETPPRTSRPIPFRYSSPVSVQPVRGVCCAVWRHHFIHVPKCVDKDMLFYYQCWWGVVCELLSLFLIVWDSHPFTFMYRLGPLCHGSVRSVRLLVSVGFTGRRNICYVINRLVLTSRPSASGLQTKGVANIYFALWSVPLLRWKWLCLKPT